MSLSDTTRGRIFNVQRFSLQDGPGLRTTVFLKGCPLACAWCHNPESQKPEPEIVIHEDRCLHCGACGLACAAPGEARLGCGACEDACPTGARRMVGRETSTRELLAEVMRDQVFFDQSGGGVTLSGGEPLLQPVFAGELMQGLKAEGVHVALDTCGFGAMEDLLALASYADLVLFDLKLADARRHAVATGEGNERILANLKALGEAGAVIWIRVPIVPGINDDHANLEATARIAAGTLGVRRVDLLPYHGTAEAKFERMGASYPLRGLEAPGPERMIQLARIFESVGLEVNIGGRP